MCLEPSRRPGSRIPTATFSTSTVVERLVGFIRVPARRRWRAGTLPTGCPKKLNLLNGDPHLIDPDLEVALVIDFGEAEPNGAPGEARQRGGNRFVTHERRITGLCPVDPLQHPLSKTVDSRQRRHDVDAELLIRNSVGAERVRREIDTSLIE